MSRAGKKLPFKVEGKPVVAEVLDFESSDSANQAQGARQTRRGAVGLRDDDLPKTPAFLKKATGRQKTQEAEVPTRPVAAAATKTIDEPSQSSRAGSKKRKSIETPEASGDEPEEEQEERASKKSARTTRNVDVEPAPIETTAHEGAQGSKRGTKTPEKAQVEEKAKAHYPTIAFQSNLSREGRTHAELLGLLTREVCSHEVQGLEDYFNKSFPDMSHRDIFIHLKNFLDELPPLVEQSCPEGAKFKPELRRSEKAAAASKTSTGGSKAQMEALRAQREELKKCAADVGAFLDGLGVGKTGAKGGKKAGSKNDLKTIDGLVSDFTSNLDSMESMLDTMLRGLDHAAAVSKKAREAQQKLFDSHQKIRFESMASGGVRVDAPSRSTRAAQAAQNLNAKDLMKAMQK